MIVSELTSETANNCIVRLHRGGQVRRRVDLKLATRLINHGPLIMVSSLYDGRIDITPVAWHMPVQKHPPMIVLEIGENHFIYDCIMRTEDFVVNILSSDMADDVVKCGAVSGRNVDKTSMCALTTEAAKAVRSPSIKEAIATLECVLVRDAHLLDEYNMVLGDIRYAEAEEGLFGEHWEFRPGQPRTLHHLGDKTFCVPADGVIDLRQKFIGNKKR